MSNNFIYKQKIKQILTIAILLGVVFVGFGNLFGHELLWVRQENMPLWIMLIADKIRNVGNLIMIIAPVALIIADWRNIFPAIKKN
jgi:hypothetical protein